MLVKAGEVVTSALLKSWRFLMVRLRRLGMGDSVLLKVENIRVRNSVRKEMSSGTA